MMGGMMKGGLDFLTGIPMKITNLIGAKVRFIQVSLINILNDVLYYWRFLLLTPFAL